MDGGAWWVTVHGVAKSRTQLSNFISIQTVRTLKGKGMAGSCYNKPLLYLVIISPFLPPQTLC